MPTRRLIHRLKIIGKRQLQRSGYLPSKTPKFQYDSEKRKISSTALSIYAKKGVATTASLFPAAVEAW
jgi:hypothetical protein